MSSGWCPDHAVCIDWIERRALQYLEDFQSVDTVYMSEDVYDQFCQKMMKNERHSGSPAQSMWANIRIVTSAGDLDVRRVPHFVNFCHVGTHATYDELVRIQVDQMFEDIFLKDCERE